MLAIKVWHEGSGSRVALNEGRWNLARVEIENKVKGVRWVVGSGGRHVVCRVLYMALLL